MTQIGDRKKGERKGTESPNEEFLHSLEPLRIFQLPVLSTLIVYLG